MNNLSFLAVSSLSRVLVGLLVMLGWTSGAAEELAWELGTSLEVIWGILLAVWGGVDTWANANRKGPMMSVLRYRD